MSKKGKTKAEKSGAEAGDGLTGRFVHDFPVLCQQQGLPPLTVRDLTNNRSDIAQSSDSILLSVGVVAVEEEDEDSPGSLHCLHLRNILLDERLLQVMNTALVEGTQLNTIKLWNVGINNETLHKLILLLKNCAVRKLYLEGSRLSADLVLPLLQCPSLQQLCLRCCCLGDAFCEVIGPALASNTTLISLDLSSNQITDEGVKHLAKSLRLNRELVSLCLSANRIGDEGVDSLCQVLVKFPLTKEEENLRNSLLTTSHNDVETNMSSSGRSSSAASFEKPSKGKSKKKDDGGGKGGSASGKGGKTKSGGGGRKTGGKGDTISDDSPSHTGHVTERESGHPLIHLVKEEENRLWMAGNATLAHLTLSCNNIGVGGVALLLGVLHHQQDMLLQMTSDPSSGRKTSATGLLRLTLQNNPIPADCPELQEVMSLMRSHDPLAIPPTVNLTDNSS